MMWDGGGHWAGGAGWESWLTPLLLIVFGAALVVALVFFVKYLRLPANAVSTAAPSSRAPAEAPESPRDILKRRYAAGEIGREDYVQMLGDL